MLSVVMVFGHCLVICKVVISVVTIERGQPKRRRIQQRLNQTRGLL